jgi:hypothetical protein
MIFSVRYWFNYVHKAVALTAVFTIYNIFIQPFSQVGTASGIEHLGADFSTDDAGTDSQYAPTSDSIIKERVGRRTQLSRVIFMMVNKMVYNHTSTLIID